MSWREAFASLQLEVEERIGQQMRAEVERMNETQDAASAALRKIAEA